METNINFNEKVFSISVLSSILHLIIFSKFAFTCASEFLGCLILIVINPIGGVIAGIFGTTLGLDISSPLVLLTIESFSIILFLWLSFLAAKNWYKNSNIKVVFYLVVIATLTSCLYVFLGSLIQLFHS